MNGRCARTTNKKEEHGENITSVNPAAHEVTAIKLTEANVHDCTVLLTLLSTQQNVGKVYAYGAYSFKQGFDAIAKMGGTIDTDTQWNNSS